MPPTDATDPTPADLVAEGLGPADGTPRLRAELAALRHALATLPLPEVPPGLSGRWEAALAVLPPLAHPAPPGGPRAPHPAPSGGPPTPDRAPPDATSPDAVPLSPVPRFPVRRFRPAHPPCAPPTPEPITRLGTPRSGTPRSGTPRSGTPRRRAATVALVAAAAALALLALPAPPSAPAPDRPWAPPALTEPRTLHGPDLPPAGQDYGPLTDPGRLAGCLARVGAAGAHPLGGSQVNLAGRAGVALLLPTAAPGRPRELVVSADCGPDTGSVLFDTVIGR